MPGIVSASVISGALGDLASIETVTKVINELTDVKRGAIAKAVATDTDASPPTRIKQDQAGAGFFGVADTGTQLAIKDDTRARARAINRLRGKKIDVGAKVDDEDKTYNVAGDNGQYISYAAITWRGKVVKDGVNADGDDTLIDKIHNTIGDGLSMSALGPDATARLRSNFAYRVVDLGTGFDDIVADSQFVTFDDLVANFGFTQLFDGEIMLGDAGTPVLSGDFASLSSLFTINVNPSTHEGTVAFNEIGLNAFGILLDLPVFSDTQALLLAGDLEAEVAAVGPGSQAEIRIITVPVPSSQLLICIGFVMVGMARITRRRRGL